MSEIEEKKKKRFQFLHRLYELTGGNELEWLNLYDIGEELGFDRKLTKTIVQYLDREGLIKVIGDQGGIAGISHWGVREVEEALSNPDTPTSRFPPVNIISTGQMISSQIQQASPEATTKVISSPTETPPRDTRTKGAQVEVMAQIFLCYAQEDEEEVEDLYQKLSDAGFKPWMAPKDILGGEKWELAVQKAIRRSDFFLACLSANSYKRGFLQKEIKYALNTWQEMLPSDIYLIPVRLEDCEVLEDLREFQWVNLFEGDGWTQLMKAIQVGMKRRVEVIKPRPEEGPEQLRKLEKWAMREEYDKMNRDRRIFWDALRQAYNRFREKQEGMLPQDLMDFLDSCGMPPGLSRVSNIRLYELRGGTPDQRVLYDFASAIYPLGTKTREELIKASIIDDKIADDFFDSRSDFGGFWDRWAERRGIKEICDEYPKERGSLIVLTWLDITHRKWTREDHEGKIHMYRLAEKLIKRHREATV